MIPIVDIGSCMKAADQQAKSGTDKNVVDYWTAVKETAPLLHDALCQHSFSLLSNHGIPQCLVNDVLRTAEAFYELPRSTKEKYVRTVGRSYGYLAMGGEWLNLERPEGDMKEVFNFCPHEEGSYPTEVPELGPSFNNLFDRCSQLHDLILDILGVALGLEDPGYLRKCHQLSGKKGNNSLVRTVYYPPCPNLKEGQMHCGEHSDFGSVTLLFMDDIGGLQILGKDGEYHDVKPVPGTVVINIGNMIQRWTADKYPATKHRVVVPRQAAEEGRARHTVGFFPVPDDDKLLTCLDGSNTYPPITVADCFFQKMNDALNQ